MLKFKVSQLERVVGGLAKIIRAADQRPDKVDTGLLYWAFRLSKKLEGEIETLMKVKLPLLKKYGVPVVEQVPGQFTKGENGRNEPLLQNTGQWSFNSPEDKEKFEEEIKKTMDGEIEIESNIYKKTFEDILELKLGGSILFDLESVLEEKEDKENKENKEEKEYVGEAHKELTKEKIKA